MKKLHVLAAIAVLILVSLGGASAQQSGTHPSKATSEVLKMAAAGIGPEVMLSYIQNTKADFQLDADDIIALKDAKVEASVIQAMLTHDTSGKAAGVASTSEAKQSAVNPDPAAPPVPLDEVVPVAPSPMYVWAPGYWSWDGATWLWVYGSWRPHYYYNYGWRHRRF
jgi:WXXGXW repeat (2 copies)